MALAVQWYYEASVVASTGISEQVAEQVLLSMSSADALL